MGWRDWRELAVTYLGPHRRLVAVLSLLLFTTIGLQLVTPQIVRTFLDRATTTTDGSITTLALVYVAAVVVQQATRIGAVWLGEVVGWMTTNHLRTDILDHCLRLDPGFHKEHTPGELIERVDGDVSGLSMFFAHFLLEVVGSFLLLVGVLAIVWWQQPRSGLVLTAVAAFGLTCMLLVRRVAVGAWTRNREASAVLYGFIEERLAGTQDIRSCGAEEHTLRGLYRVGRDRLWTNRRARVLSAVTWVMYSVVSCAATAVSFLLPALLVRDGQITIGGAFALYFYTGLLLQPLDRVSDQVERMQQAVAGGRRVLELLRTRSAVVDGPGAALPGGALAVRLDHVTFGYGTDEPVLHDVDLAVPAGGVLGVVGRTGSGKSTLARLVVRLHDAAGGSVRLGGVDVRELTRRDVRSRVSLVTQEVHVLRATVRDNLTLFDPDVADARILDAIEHLGLHRWLEQLPAGLDTMLREGGSGMSAGQSQLLAFGRAFLADPSVVILDEASSRLDPATEDLLETAVDALLRGRTGIVIAHRLSTLERCDAICVLDHGRVVEHGPRQLLASDASSRYATLLRAGLDVVT
jgi:ATP-binding cassette subfamily B protein